MTLKFVSTSTSSQINKGFPTMRSLKKDESIAFTFLCQQKEFVKNGDFPNDPVFVEMESCYDETTKSYFKFSDSVDPALKAKILKIKSVKLSKKTLAVILEYKIGPKKEIVNINDLFIIRMGSDKLKTLMDIEENERISNPNFSLFDVDYSVRCDDETYQKWAITPRKDKAFSKMDEDAKKDLITRAHAMINDIFPKIGGKVLDDEELMEKFGLESEDDADINPMQQSANGGEFANLKAPAKNPFGGNN